MKFINNQDEVLSLRIEHYLLKQVRECLDFSEYLKADVMLKFFLPLPAKNFFRAAAGEQVGAVFVLAEFFKEFFPIRLRPVRTVKQAVFFDWLSILFSSDISVFLS